MFLLDNNKATEEQRWNAWGRNDLSVIKLTPLGIDHC